MLARDKFTMVSVPSDGSCLYWATCLAYLFPVRHSPSLFAERFTQAFGRDDSPRQENSSHLRDLLIGWNLLGQKTAFSHVISFMQPLVNGEFRQRVIQEMSTSRDKYQHFITLSSFCESQNEGFFTRGLFQKHFESEFAFEIEQCGVDISKLKPKSLGVMQRAEVEAELDKMLSQHKVASFKYEMYLKCMALSTSWGGQPEIQAASQVLKCNIHVFQDVAQLPGISFVSGFHWIHLEHSNGNHYKFGLVRASILLEAMKQGMDFENIERCLSIGVDDVNVSNRFGWTMLHFAAKAGDVKLVKLLIGHGADVNAKNTQQKTPAYLAQKYGQFNVLLLLGQELLNVTENSDKHGILTQLSKNAKQKHNTLQDIPVPRDQDKTAAMQTGVNKMGHLASQSLQPIPKTITSKTQRNCVYKMASKATQTPDWLLGQRNASLEKMDDGEKLSKASQRASVLSGHVAPSWQVKILQQQLLEVIRERDALKKTLLANKQIEHDNQQVLINKVQPMEERSLDSLTKDIVDLEEENSSLKKNVDELEHELRDTHNVVSENTTTGNEEKVATGDVWDKLKKQADSDKRILACPHWLYKNRDHRNTFQGQPFEVKYLSCQGFKHAQQFSMASNMQEAGHFGNMVFRYLLPEHENCNTAIEHLDLMYKADLTRSTLLNTIEYGVFSSPTYCQNYKFIKDKRINEEKFKFGGNFDSMDVNLNLLTGASIGRELRSRIRNRTYRTVKLFDIHSTGQAFSFVNEVYSDVQSELQLWWQDERYCLNKSAAFLKDIVLNRINVHMYSKVWNLIKGLNVKFLTNRIVKLKQAMSNICLINIFVAGKGSTFLTACKVYDTFLTLEEQVAIFVSVKDFLKSKSEKIGAWQSIVCQTLVVLCEPDTTDDDIGLVISELNSIFNKSRMTLRVVLISENSLALSGKQCCKDRDFLALYDYVSWDDMTEETHTRIVSHTVMFQGKQMPLSSLVEMEAVGQIMGQVNGETLEKLLKGDHVESIGSQMKDEINNYVPRKLERGNKVINITSVSDVPDRVVLITAEHGMGQSTLFRHLAITAQIERPCAWVCHVNLSDAMIFLKALKFDFFNSESVFKLIAKFSVSEGKGMELERGILRNCIMVTGRILVFIDGVDNMCTYFEDEVCCLLKNMLETKIAQLWVTSPMACQNKLENVLGKKSYKLQPFAKQDQRRFLKGYWNSETPLEYESRVNVFISVLLEMVEKTCKEEQFIVNVPQHLSVLAEYLKDHFKRFINTGILSLPTKLDLSSYYEALVEKKFQIYLGENIALKTEILSSEANIYSIKQMYVKRHQHAALLSLLSQDEFKTLNIDTIDDTHFLNMVREGREQTGIISKMVNGKPHFISRTIEEFFAAIWFAKNFISCRQLLKKILLHTDYKVLRNIFNLYLTRGHKLHTAVIDGDIDLVQQLVSSDPANVDSRDAGGRSALFLSVLYSCTEKHADYIHITKMLLECGASIELRDNVFEWKPLECADYTNEWNVAGLIMKRFGKIMDIPKARKQMDPKVYSKFVDYLSRADLSHDKLLVAALKHEDISVLKYLVKVGIDLNACDLNGQTALMIASGYGRLQIAEYLIHAGSDVNIENDIGWNCLLVAIQSGFHHICKYLLGIGAKLKGSLPSYELEQKNAVFLCAAFLGDLDIVEYQIQQEATVQSENKTGWCALLLASSEGHFNVMEHLISKGAKITFNETVAQTIELINASLLCASFLGEQDLIVQLLKCDIEINASSSSGWNSLLYAMKQNQIETVELLLTNGANINLTDIPNFSQLQKDIALQCVSFQNRLDVTKALIEQGANMNVTNKEGWNSFLLAIDRGNFEVMEYFSELNTTWKNFRARSGSSLFHKNNYLLWASFVGSLENIKRLLKRDAHVNHTNRKGWNALLHASQQGNINCMEYLLSQKGEIILSENMCLERLNVTLFSASFQGNVDLMSNLIKLGAKVNAQSNNGWNSLLFSAYAGHLDATEFLVTQGANIPVLNNRNYSNLTKNVSLMCTAFTGDLKTTKYLLSYGADILAENRSGWNALMYATCKGKEDCLKHLLEQGFALSAHQIEHSTQIQKNLYLLSAVFSNNLDLVNTLVASGASVNFSNQSGTTPLHVALDKNAHHLVKYLLENGASLNACDNRGLSPLQLGSTPIEPLDHDTYYGNIISKNSNVAKILVNNGDDTYSETVNGITLAKKKHKHSTQHQ